jgi:hypothetical protein
VALVQVELRRRKTTNAQPRFFKCFSKLLQTFVALEIQTKNRILERTKVKAKRAKKDM